MALVAAAPTAAIGAGPDIEAFPRTEPLDVGQSRSGNYLAGRHAQLRRDFAAAADLFAAAVRDMPGSGDVLSRLHFARVLAGRIDAAAAVAERLVARAGAAAEPADPFARLTLAVVALRDGDPERAEALAAALPDTAVHRVLRPLLRAWAFFDQGRLDDALAALEPLSWNERTSSLYHLHMALLNDAAGRLDAAGDHYVAATEDDTVPPMRLVQLVAQFHQRTGDVTAAAAVLEQFLEAQPDRHAFMARERQALETDRPLPREIDNARAGVAEAMFGAASALARQDSLEQALALARYGLFLQPEFTPLRLLASGLMESFGRYREANALYDGVAPESHLSWHARLSRASNLNRLDRLEAAEEALRALSAERPDSADPLIELGDILRGRERFRDAVDAYDDAISRMPDLRPENWALLYARGIALERSSMWPRAEQDFLKALEFQPDQPYVLNYLGYSWVDRGENLKQALTMIERAVALRPNDGYIVDSLGWAHYKLGNYERAVRELERAVSLRPHDPLINDHLGDAYWRVGRQREARLQWRNALTRDPAPPVRTEIEQKLEHGLRDDPPATADPGPTNQVSADP